MFVTFLLSSLLHELVMAIVSGKLRGYLFAMQMAQIPLMALGQVRGKSALRRAVLIMPASSRSPS